MMRSSDGTTCRTTFAICATLLIVIATADAQVTPVTVVIVRHPEVVNEPTIPLSPVGRQRAQLLVQTFKDLRFTHLFATHTTRARQTVEPVAAAQKLSIAQLPAPGSMLNGEAVSENTSRQAAIDPIARALLKLPAGSVALVGANSDNLYGILNRLGVPVATPGQTCTPVSPCVPCLTNACYPGNEYDQLWYLVIEAGKPRPLVMIESRYGAGWTPSIPAKQQ